MRTTDLIRISARQILRQYRKNIGVVLTIILGTAGLIVVLTMGRSIEDNISSNLEIIGNATRLRVVFKHISSHQFLYDDREFTQETIKSIRAIPGVDQVGTIVIKHGRAKLSTQRNIGMSGLFGVDESFWKVHGSRASFGRLLNNDDLRQHRAVCVLGQRTAQELFGHIDVVGRYITVDRNLLQVVGILDLISMPDKSRVVFLPLTTAQDRIDRISPVNKIYIRCHSWDDVEDVSAAIPGVVKSRQPNEEIEIFYPEEILTRVKAIALGVKIFVQLALVSTLILGGIGIWNIMMMSVRSRTREIGLKKAIGAEDHDILFQFLAESLMLSTGAMFLGFFLGWGGVSITSSILKKAPPEELFWLSVIIGFFFSLVLGLVAGIAPAVKASRMEVVSALRYE